MRGDRPRGRTRARGRTGGRAARRAPVAQRPRRTGGRDHRARTAPGAAAGARGATSAVGLAARVGAAAGRAGGSGRRGGGGVCRTGSRPGPGPPGPGSAGGSAVALAGRVVAAPGSGHPGAVTAAPFGHGHSHAAALLPCLLTVPVLPVTVLGGAGARVRYRWAAAGFHPVRLRRPLRQAGSVRVAVALALAAAGHRASGLPLGLAPSPIPGAARPGSARHAGP